MDCIPISLLKLLYPLPEKHQTRTRPLRVLCLGLGRTGTESLSLALTQLNYTPHHGWRLAGPEGAKELIQWTRLGRAKRSNDTTALTRSEFDKVLGDCDATTDLPSSTFGVELLRAYPEAKVVLNRRQDVEKWYVSQRATMDTIYRDWGSLIRQFLEPEFFWMGRCFDLIWRRAYGGDFTANGRAYYRDHYAELEVELKRQDRQWLDWTVQDGWEPLCEFLGKDVPDTPLPNENAAGGFAAKRAALHAVRLRRARRNAAVIGMLLSMGVAWYLYAASIKGLARKALEGIKIGKS